VRAGKKLDLAGVAAYKTNADSSTFEVRVETGAEGERVEDRFPVF
jgi:hypothetical protein